MIEAAVADDSETRLGVTNVIHSAYSIPRTANQSQVFEIYRPLRVFSGGWDLGLDNIDLVVFYPENVLVCSDLVGFRTLSFSAPSVS